MNELAEKLLAIARWYSMTPEQMETVNKIVDILNRSAGCNDVKYDTIPFLQIERVREMVRSGKRIAPHPPVVEFEGTNYGAFGGDEIMKEFENKKEVYCDRNLCYMNDVNGIGCDECVANRK